MSSGSYNRIKGHSFERSIAKLFRQCGWKNAARNLREVVGRHAIRHHDLEHTCPFAVQCKATEACASDMKLIDGIKLDPHSGHVFPILVRKRNRCQPTVTMKVEDIAEIFSSLEREASIPRDLALVTMPVSHFSIILTALKKAGLYAKDCHE